MEKGKKSQYFEFEKFEDYTSKNGRIDTTKPIYKKLFTPKELTPVVYESGKKGHSLIVVPTVNDVFEVKGSVDAIVSKIEMEME